MNLFLLALFLSFLPFSELRGGIPVAIVSGANPFLAFFCCTLINLLVSPFVFFILNKISMVFFKKQLHEHSIIRKMKNKKLEKRINQYGYLALTFFVAIPLPATGAWTASVISWLLGLKPKKAIIAISLGVIIAGLIVTFASLGFLQFLKLF